MLLFPFFFSVALCSPQVLVNMVLTHTRIPKNIQKYHLPLMIQIFQFCILQCFFPLQRAWENNIAWIVSKQEQQYKYIKSYKNEKSVYRKLFNPLQTHTLKTLHLITSHHQTQLNSLDWAFSPAQHPGPCCSCLGFFYGLFPHDAVALLPGPVCLYLYTRSRCQLLLWLFYCVLKALA